jgi:hypothetical protein
MKILCLQCHIEGVVEYHTDQSCMDQNHMVLAFLFGHFHCRVQNFYKNPYMSILRQAPRALYNVTKIFFLAVVTQIRRTTISLPAYSTSTTLPPSQYWSILL